MIFTETPLAGAYVIELERLEDERGFFARSWCADEYSRKGLEAKVVQANVSLNKQSGTLRGMHYQAPPFAESKVVSCTRGAIYDVIIDLRAGSSTFLRWFGVELNADNRKTLYVPKFFAHGFLTLQDHSEVTYLISEFYSPQHARGVRWNDGLFGIRWPKIPQVLSVKDGQYADARQEDFAELR
jgi:dTDP-4-dehydrorhamnose 3,5-epimerase